MLYLFDLDDTLAEGYVGKPGRRFGEVHLLPGRRERMQALRAAGHELAIITNQAGVAFPSYGISEYQVEDKIVAVWDALGLPLNGLARICYAHPNSPLESYRDPAQVARRKPSGAMIREAIAFYPLAAAGGVIYVGDRPEDQAAAAAAGVAFSWAADFFRPPDPACTCGVALKAYTVTREDDTFYAGAVSDTLNPPTVPTVLAASLNDVLLWATSFRAPEHDVQNPATGQVAVGGLCQYPDARP